MKTIYYFCDFRSVYNDNLISELKKKGVPVVFVSIEENFRNSIFGFFYKVPLLRTFFFVLFTYSFFLHLDNNKESRVAHLHFISAHCVFFCPFLKFKFSKVILTFWGSDLLRQNKNILRLMTPLFDCADAITFETKEMKNKFLMLLPKYMENDNFYYVRFGLTILDEIDKLSEDDVDIFCQKYFIDKKKPVIVVGYNRARQQQHIEVLKSFAENECLKNLQIIIPWTYGYVDDSYENEIVEVLNSLRVSYVFLKDFLSDHEIACLRTITDVFVQVQTTDSFSASMLECLYAKKSIITGTWLPYAFLYEKGIKMYKVNSPSGVGKILQPVINSIPKDIDVNRRNAEIVSSFARWDNCIKDWINLYN